VGEDEMDNPMISSQVVYAVELVHENDISAEQQLMWEQVVLQTDETQQIEPSKQ
jgi:hypothetical protein